MKLTVSYSGQARAAASRASEGVDLPAGSTLHDLLLHLSSRHGEPMAALLHSAQRGAPAVLIFVGEQQVRWDAPPPLKDGDHVMLLSPISGG